VAKRSRVQIHASRRALQALIVHVIDRSRTGRPTYRTAKCPGSTKPSTSPRSALSIRLVDMHSASPACQHSADRRRRGAKSDVYLRFADVNAPNGSTVVCELALRPGFHPKPECHQRRVPRHEARGLAIGFDCGAGALFDGVTALTGGGFVPIWWNARGFRPSSSRAV
jgi:hypothetical protein